MRTDEDLVAATELAAREVLAEHGPLDFDEVVDALVASAVGDADADDLEDALGEAVERFACLIELPDDKIADVTTLLDGVVATHRLSRPELEAGVVVHQPDLVVLARLEHVDGGAVLSGGHLLAHRHLGEGCGWAGTAGVAGRLRRRRPGCPAGGRRPPGRQRRDRRACPSRGAG
jgi:hypothetical protein